MQNWLKYNNIPSLNILSKCDYISRSELRKKIDTLKKEFKNEVLPNSSKNKDFSEDILNWFHNNG